MIGNMPKAYPDELIYSVLARCYVADGYLIYREFAEDVFVNKKEAPSVEFLGGIKKDVKKRLFQSYGTDNLVQLICKGTQFPYYTRFYPVERKKQALEALCQGDKVNDLIRLSTQREERYLRYCPECILEDRRNYGETYWHRSHQLKGVSCCSRHGIKLLNSSLFLSGNVSPNFLAAEIVLQDCDMTSEKAVDKEVMLARYHQELLEAELDIEREITPITVIKNALYLSHYTSNRGGAYRLKKIENDMALFYKGCPGEALQITQISKFLAGKRIQPIDYVRMALFLGIDKNKLLSPADQVFCIAKFDEACIHLLQSGVGVNETARRLGVNSSTVRNIRDGKLNTEKISQRGKGGRKSKDWETLDLQYLPQVEKIVCDMKEKAGERPFRITRYAVAMKLNIPPKTFQRLRYCADYVGQFTETQEEYWAREVIWAIGKIEAEGIELNYTAIRKLINVRRKHINAALPYIKDVRIKNKILEMNEG